LKQLKDEAIKKLSLISEDREKYLNLLTNLIAQCLFRLIEKEVVLKCREKDVDLVNVKLFVFNFFDSFIY
jgi:V-type H+-transporting ATPase subunit E